jgi:hypothetical protein
MDNGWWEGQGVVECVEKERVREKGQVGEREEIEREKERERRERESRERERVRVSE